MFVLDSELPDTWQVITWPAVGTPQSIIATAGGPAGGGGGGAAVVKYPSALTTYVAGVPHTGSGQAVTSHR